MTRFLVLDLFLNTMVAIMAALVWWKFCRLFVREHRRNAWSPAAVLQCGIMFTSGSVALFRLYWMPWYALVAAGKSPILFYDFLFAYRLNWVVPLVLITQTVGLFLHLHVSFARPVRGIILRGVGRTVFIAALLAGACFAAAIFLSDPAEVVFWGGR